MFSAVNIGNDLKLLAGKDLWEGFWGNSGSRECKVLRQVSSQIW